jgi:hypothetical protein
MSESRISESRRKCAHDQCKCEVSSTERFCSDYCKDAAEIEEVELQCACGHAPCELD